MTWITPTTSSFLQWIKRSSDKNLGALVGKLNVDTIRLNQLFSMMLNSLLDDERYEPKTTLLGLFRIFLTLKIHVTSPLTGHTLLPILYRSVEMGPKPQAEIFERSDVQSKVNFGDESYRSLITKAVCVSACSVIPCCKYAQLITMGFVRGLNGNKQSVTPRKADHSSR